MLSNGSEVGDAVASWLVRSSTGRAVRVRALAGDTMLCSWARLSTLQGSTWEWGPMHSSNFQLIMISS